MIKNTTEYTIEKYKQFEKTRDFRNTIISIIVAAVFSLIFWMVFIFTKEGNEIFMYAAIIIMVVGLAYFLWKMLKKPKITAQIIRDYVFLENEFDVVSSNKGNRSNSSYKYFQVTECLSDKYSLYLFISKTSAFIISNDGYTLGDKAMLVDLLASKGIEIKK